MRCRSFLFFLFLLCLATAAAQAADVAQLIQQMDADKFSERKSATQQLSDMGAAAIPALKEATASDSREVAQRAFSILEGHFSEGDKETKEAAEAALEQLAAGEGKAARRAQQILEPEPAPSQIARALAPGRIAIGAPAIARVQIRQAGGNGRRFRMRVANGVKEITVEENGKKIEIKEDPNNGIKVEVTEKKDGKETTKKYEAKDAAQLKKNHPEAHKLYEKHSMKNGGIQIRAARPAAPAVPQQPRIAQMRKNHFDRIKKSLDDQIERFEKQAEQAEGPRKDHFKQMVENLRRHRKSIEDIERRQRPAQAPAP